VQPHKLLEQCTATCITIYTLYTPLTCYWQFRSPWLWWWDWSSHTENWRYSRHSRDPGH